MGPFVSMLQGMIYDLLSFVLILLMGIVAYAIATEAILFPNSELSWKTLYHLPRRAYWQVYGELFLEDLEGTGTCTNNATLYHDYKEMRCPTDVGRYFVPIALAVYIIFTNVLLLDFLVAMFNDTYQSIKKERLTYWGFLRFRLILEYSCRPALPPPFQLISRFWCVGKWLRGQDVDNENPFRVSYARMGNMEWKLIYWENMIADEYLAQISKLQEDKVSPHLTIPSVTTNEIVAERLEKVESQVENVSHTLDMMNDIMQEMRQRQSEWLTGMENLESLKRDKDEGIISTEEFKNLWEEERKKQEKAKKEHQREREYNLLRPNREWWIVVSSTEVDRKNRYDCGQGITLYNDGEKDERKMTKSLELNNKRKLGC